MRLQQTVTGQVEGTAIVEVLANGPDTFGDLQLTLTIEREGDTIRIGLRHVPGQESTVLINPQGTGIGLIIDFILESLDDTEVPLGQVEAIIKGPGDPFTQDEWTGRVSDIALPIAGDFDGDGMDDGLVLRDGEFVFTRIRFDASEATAAPAEPSGRLLAAAYSAGRFRAWSTAVYRRDFWRHDARDAAAAGSRPVG